MKCQLFLSEKSLVFDFYIPFLSAYYDFHLNRYLIHDYYSNKDYQFVNILDFFVCINRIKDERRI